MARSAVLCLFLLLCQLLATGAPAQPLPPDTGFPSQPAAVRDLRANFDLSAEQLRLHALSLRQQQVDPVARAWATLALIEFENELEHEPEVFALLDELNASSVALKVHDLRFATLELSAVVYMHRNRVEQSRAALDEMQQMVSQFPNRQWQTLLRHDEGVLQRKLGRFDQALTDFEAAAELQKDGSNPSLLARELNSIGMLHGRTGRFSDAALVHNEALALARKAGDKPEMARSLRLLGVLYRNLDDEERGTEYLREALAQVQARNHREAIILTAELGISLMNMERFDEAAGFIEQAVAMAEQSGNAQNKVNAYSRMADLELVRGHWESAKRWVDRAWLEYDHVAVRDQVLLGLSRVRVFSARGATPETLAQARATLEGARKIGDRILERAALDVVADLELGLGDAASAYATRKTHQKLDKELAMDIAGRRIAVLEASLEQERGNMEKQLLTSENQIKDLRITRQRYLGLALVSGMIALVAVLLLLFWRVRTMRRTNAELRANRDQLAQLHAALLKTSERLEHMANTDALTGVANRHAVMRRIEELWQRGRIGGDGCLMLIDMDHFKLVNDRYSHLAGDAVLRTAAERMLTALPDQALLGRWGGEEFIVVLPTVAEADALAIAERLRQRLDDSVEWQQSAIRCSGSIGVAMLDAARFSSADEWIAASDRALYRAKREGRNRVQLASRDPAEDLALRTRAND
ncbi:MAG: GGDEF domain-containing protein [Rhodanobacteraceae bacterium]|nr:GGDEF domain-containing protein [Rhodanobacteraceae bacterium]